MKQLSFILLILIFLTSCSNIEPKLSSSATILIKTPTMKYYDKGFIQKFDNYTQVQIYNAGQTLLDLKIYDDQVCMSTFKCQSLKEFNKINLHETYDEKFIKNIFESNKKEIVHKDRENGILIKIKKD